MLKPHDIIIKPIITEQTMTNMHFMWIREQTKWK
jgi:ribosomal protein L23